MWVRAMDEFKDIQQVDFYWDRPEKGFIWDPEAETVARSLYRYPGSIARVIYRCPQSAKKGREIIHEILIDQSMQGEKDPNILSYEHLTPPRLEGPFLVEAQGANGYYRQNRIMQDEANLFSKFACLNPDDPQTVLDFANAWGMLTEGETEVTSSVHPDGSEPVLGRQRLLTNGGEAYMEGRQGVPTLPAESLAFWKREIIEMGQLFSVWDQFKQRDLGALRRVIRWPLKMNAVSYSLPVWQGKEYTVPDDKEIIPGMHLGWLADSDHTSPEVFKRFKRGDLLLPAYYLLQKYVNKKIEKMEEEGIGSVRPRLLLNQENEIGSYLRPSNLLSALWLQFYQAICGERRIVRCPLCGSWEDITDKARPNRWKGHPSCLNVKRVAEYRKRNPLDR